MSEMKLFKMREEDIPSIYKLLHKKFVEKHFKESVSKKEWEYIELYKKLLKNDFFSIFVIKNRNSEIFGFLNFYTENQISEIEIFLDRDYRGKGYAEEILKNGIDIVSQEKEIKKFQAHILKENEISKKIFMKLGFIFKKFSNYKGSKYMLFEKIIVD